MVSIPFLLKQLQEIEEELQTKQERLNWLRRLQQFRLLQLNRLVIEQIKRERTSEPSL